MNTKYEYKINKHFSKEDNCYIASVPELGPYISAFGDTYDDALREIQTVILLTFKTYKDDKLSPPKTKKIKKAMYLKTLLNSQNVYSFTDAIP